MISKARLKQILINLVQETDERVKSRHTEIVSVELDCTSDDLDKALEHIHLTLRYSRRDTVNGGEVYDLCQQGKRMSGYKIVYHPSAPSIPVYEGPRDLLNTLIGAVKEIA